MLVNSLDKFGGSLRAYHRWVDDGKKLLAFLSTPLDSFCAIEELNGENFSSSIINCKEKCAKRFEDTLTSLYEDMFAKRCNCLHRCAGFFLDSVDDSSTESVAEDQAPTALLSAYAVSADTEATDSADLLNSSEARVDLLVNASSPEMFSNETRVPTLAPSNAPTLDPSQPPTPDFNFFASWTSTKVAVVALSVLGVAVGGVLLSKYMAKKPAKKVSNPPAVVVSKPVIATGKKV